MNHPANHLVDLTVPVNSYPCPQTVQIENSQVAAEHKGRLYHYHCHRIGLEANTGTHINFPSHLEESGSGLRSGNLDISRFWDIPSTVVHIELNGRESVCAEMIQAALRGPVHPHLILHALGDKDQSAYPNGQGQPWLAESAVRWLLSQNIRILTSDILEYPGADMEKKTGICIRLYEKQCCIVFGVRNLHLLRHNECRSFILPLCIDGLTQVPCWMLAAQD